ncbi:MAG: alpha/beta hydrolase [Rubrivivax sp.]
MAWHAASVAALIFGLIGILFAWCALMPKGAALDRLSVWYLAFGLSGSELSALLATLGLMLAAGAWALGAADDGLGRFALALHAAAIAGLLWALWRARTTFTVLDAALRQAFGADYEQRIAPARRALLRRRLAPAMWWKPFSYRRADVDWRRNIDYVAGAHKQQRLDVMVPRAPAAGPRPILLNIHGGGWIIGDKGTQAMPWLMHMASCGWLVVDADYRLSPGVRMPEHLIDVKRAIAWTRMHAADYGGDPRFIVITGGSAGGHLSALAALTPNQPQWQPGFESVDTRVQAAVPLYGKFDLLGQHRPDPPFADFMARKVMPGPRAEHDALWQAMDPATQMRALAPGERPPMLIVHGTHDELIPLAEARWFVGALRAASSADLLYVELPFAHHGFDVPNSLRADLTVEALQRYLELQYAQWCARNGGAATPAAA